MARRKNPSKALAQAAGQDSPVAAGQLLDDLRALIQQGREGIAQAVNSALVLLYWQVGFRVRAEILKQQRAAYGEEIVSTLSKQWAAEFGDGFSRPNLSRMTRFAEAFPDREIVGSWPIKLAALSSHTVHL